MDMTRHSHQPLNGDYYQPRDGHGPIGTPCKTVAEAVQQALAEEGRELRFERDASGCMHCFTSASQIGPHAYRHQASDPWPAPFESTLKDDKDAIAAIVQSIMLNPGRCHENHAIRIDIDTYIDGEFICTNFESLPSGTAN